MLDVPPAAQAALVVAVNTKRQKTERHALTDPNLTPSMNKLFKVPRSIPVSQFGCLQHGGKRGAGEAVSLVTPLLLRVCAETQLKVSSQPRGYLGSTAHGGAVERAVQC